MKQPDDQRQHQPSDSGALEDHPEVPTPGAGQETLMQNRHTGIAAERPGAPDDDPDRAPATTPDPPGPHPDPDPDPTEPPSPVPQPDPDAPSVST